MSANVPAPSAAPLRKGGADIELLVPAPAPAIESWAPALLDALSSCAGTPVSFLRGPELGAHADGPWAFHFELAGSGPRALPPAWSGPLSLRLGDGDAELRREEAALRFCRTGGLSVPEVLASLDLGASGNDSSDLRATHALVTRVPDSLPLPELVEDNLRRSDELINGFARHHAALHDFDPDGLESCVPVLSVADELQRVDEDRFGAHVDWLRAHTHPSARIALCHGTYQPFCISGPPSDQWDEVGGPGGGLTISNWCGAILAEREFDVGYTLVALWMLPSFAKTRPHRTAMKMIRNTISNRYRVEYSSVAPLDLERLRFWQAFHALLGMARLGGAYDDDGSPFAAPHRAPLAAAMGPELDRLLTMLRRV
jgi:hypothetical protein